MPSDDHTGRKMDVHAWEWLTPNPNGTWQGNLGYQPPADPWGHKEPIPLVRQADALREIERLRAEVQRLTAYVEAFRREERRADDAERDRDDARAEVHRLTAENAALRKGLEFYANGDHFDLVDENEWDTVSGEPANWWCDEAGTATVEDGSLAKAALAGKTLGESDE